MNLRLNAASALPPFEQVRVQLIEMIGTGALVAGSRLPTVRALAAELSLAPNTIARAYKELEEANFIETRGRAGTFVSTGADGVTTAAVEAARVFTAEMHKLGVSGEDAISFVLAAFDR